MNGSVKQLGNLLAGFTLLPELPHQSLLALGVQDSWSSLHLQHCSGRVSVLHRPVESAARSSHMGVRPGYCSRAPPLIVEGFANLTPVLMLLLTDPHTLWLSALGQERYSIGAPTYSREASDHGCSQTWGELQILSTRQVAATHKATRVTHRLAPVLKARQAPAFHRRDAMAASTV
jgi:hypothetical protein